jgi:hypothetical protein
MTSLPTLEAHSGVLGAVRIDGEYKSKRETQKSMSEYWRRELEYQTNGTF